MDKNGLCLLRNDHTGAIFIGTNNEKIVTLHRGREPIEVGYILNHNDRTVFSMLNHLDYGDVILEPNKAGYPVIGVWTAREPEYMIEPFEKQTVLFVDNGCGVCIHKGPPEDQGIYKDTWVSYSNPTEFTDTNYWAPYNE